MTRYRIDADDAEQFRRIKDLAEGRAHVFLTSERRLFVATGDLPDDLRRDLLDIGAHIIEERPHHLERGLERGTAPVEAAKPAARCKIKASDDEQFRAAKAVAEAGNVRLLGESPRYRFLWAEEPAPQVRERILATGARIIPDQPVMGFDRAPAPVEPAPKEALLARLRSQPALGLNWTRDELYEGGP